MSQDKRCGVCPHEADDHNAERGWCTVQGCRCERFIPWANMARNIPGMPTAEQEKRTRESVAAIKADRLRRQLAAVIDSALLVELLMAACNGDLMIQSKVVDTLLKAGLILIGQDPTSTTQPL